MLKPILQKKVDVCPLVILLADFVSMLLINAPTVVTLVSWGDERSAELIQASCSPMSAMDSAVLVALSLNSDP